MLFLSTLSLRRATQIKQTCRAEISISIHALLAESDGSGLARLAPRLDFYPRSPCGERLFRHCTTYLNCSHFYPRSPCGERLPAFWLLDSNAGISIHALLAESDTPMVTPPSYKHNFYPRSPCGERRQAQSLKVAALSISIHALLAESDRERSE